jgi:hypothetical protein
VRRGAYILSLHHKVSRNEVQLLGKGVDDPHIEHPTRHAHDLVADRNSVGASLGARLHCLVHFKEAGRLGEEDEGGEAEKGEENGAAHRPIS